jgi:hypothetical protein
MTAEQELPILDAEVIAVVDLDELLEKPLQHPPALRVVCACGKNGTPEAHGFNPITGHRALTCAEVLEIAARVNAGPTPRRRVFGLFGGA